MARRALDFSAGILSTPFDISMYLTRQNHELIFLKQKGFVSCKTQCVKELTHFKNIHGTRLSMMPAPTAISERYSLNALTTPPPRVYSSP